MRMPALPIFILAAAILPGCATQTVPEPPSGGISVMDIPVNTPLCVVNGNNAADCVIELTVADDPKDSKGCLIELANEDNDLLSLRGAVGKVIYWRITPNTSPYQFTKDGIAFIDNFRPRMFDEGERIEGNKRAFQWKVVNDKRRVNGYIINVRKDGGSRRCDRDPWVRSK